MKEFKVTILGCGSAMPHKHHWPSSQVVQFDSTYYVIDAGEGLQYHLHKHKVSPNKVKCIFISHIHGDHLFGLIGYILMLELAGRAKPLHIFGPQGLEDYIQMQLKQFGTPCRFEIVFHTVDKEEEIFSTNNLSVESVKLRHRGLQCYGYIFREKAYRKINVDIDAIEKAGINKKYINCIKKAFDEDVDVVITLGNKEIKCSDFCKVSEVPCASYAYCSDNSFPHEVLQDGSIKTNLDENSHIVERLKSVTTLYHECSYMNKDIDKAMKHHHTTAVEAATLAQLAGVKELVIGHLSSRYPDEQEVLNEARTIFKNTQLADEDTIYPIKI